MDSLLPSADILNPGVSTKKGQYYTYIQKSDQKINKSKSGFFTKYLRSHFLAILEKDAMHFFLKRQTLAAKTIPCKFCPDKHINKHPEKEIRCLLSVSCHALSRFPTLSDFCVFPNEPVTHPDWKQKHKDTKSMERPRGMKRRASLPKVFAARA